jgi:hypothetical protein
VGETDIVAVVTALLARAPEWIRQDLSSKDGTLRSRAEETLALLIGTALKESRATDGTAVDRDAHGI